jgi:phosphonate transport system substrate-binding protein
LAEICELMGQDLGVLFFPHVAPSYRALAHATETGQVAFAWMPPLLVLELEDRRSVVPLVSPLRWGTTSSFYSAIIVRPGGPKTVAELYGKRAAWVERESVAGFMVPRLHLAAHGFPLNRFASETFLHSHETVVDAVAEGRADVGATFCTVDPQTKRIVHGAWTRANGSNLRPVEVMARVGPIPNDAIVANGRVNGGLREAVTDWFIHSESRRAREILAPMVHADTFARVSAPHYAPLRAMVAEARARGLDRGSAA